MDQKNFIEQYFDIGKKIHDICLEELGLPVEDARLYVYIHVKNMETGSLNYFTQKDENAESVITMLTGKFKGVESYKSQLDDRLRLHTDEQFRKEKIGFYIENILPKLK